MAAGRTKWWINLTLLIAVVALIAVPFAVRSATGTGDGSYAGTDSSAVSQVHQLDPGYRPWFHPIFETGSSEVQSGLFALQAAIGAGALGFVLGRLSGRRRTGQSQPDPVGPGA